MSSGPGTWSTIAALLCADVTLVSQYPTLSERSPSHASNPPAVAVVGYATMYTVYEVVAAPMNVVIGLELVMYVPEPWLNVAAPRPVAIPFAFHAIVPLFAKLFPAPLWSAHAVIFPPLVVTPDSP